MAVEWYDQIAPDWVSTLFAVVDTASEPGADALPELSIAVTWYVYDVLSLSPCRRSSSPP